MLIPAEMQPDALQQVQLAPPGHKDKHTHTSTLCWCGTPRTRPAPTLRLTHDDTHKHTQLRKMGRKPAPGTVPYFIPAICTVWAC